MTAPYKALGRGLQSLLSAQQRNAHRTGAIPIAAIRPGTLQPRKAIPEEPLEKLAALIRAKGVVQPIVVRAVPGLRLSRVETLAPPPWDGSASDR